MKESKTEQRVYVVLGIFELMVDRVQVASSKQQSDVIEREMCKEMKVPFDRDERERFFADGNGTTVQVFDVNVE